MFWTRIATVSWWYFLLIILAFALTGEVFSYTYVAGVNPKVVALAFVTVPIWTLVLVWFTSIIQHYEHAGLTRVIARWLCFIFIISNFSLAFSTLFASSTETYFSLLWHVISIIYILAPVWILCHVIVVLYRDVYQYSPYALPKSILGVIIVFIGWYLTARVVRRKIRESDDNGDIALTRHLVE